jgi:tetratricopeptide (TPR) repeat protein
MNNQTYARAIALSQANDWLGSNLVLDGIPATEATEVTQADKIEVLRLYAKNFRLLGQFHDALNSLDRLLALDPKDTPSWLEKAICLEGLGKKEEAIALIFRLVVTEPKNPWALMVWLRMRAEDEPPATIIEELYEIENRSLIARDYSTVIDGVRNKLLVLHDSKLLLEIDTRNILELKSALEEITSEDLATIYSHFESLGFNCEFGFAQRSAGVEPIGLFRWSGIEPHNLMAVMRNSLKDFDSPEHFSLELQPSRQYFLKDSKYGTVTHTHILAGTIPKNVLLKKIIQRQSFLKRKLLSDIKIGKKIFVYRFYNDPHDDYVRELVVSMQGIGMKKILIARASDENHQPGSCRVFSEGVMIGYISANYPNTVYSEWDQIVQDVYAYFQGLSQQKASISCHQLIDRA